MIRITAALAASAAALTLTVAPANAESALRSAEVRFGDLDLTRESGAEALLRRIERAAEGVCGAGNVSFRDRRAARAARACVESAMSQAVASIEAPLVQTIYAERRGSPAPVVALN